MSGWIWWVAAGAAVLVLALCRRPLGALCRVAARSGLGLVFLWLFQGVGSFLGEYQAGGVIVVLGVGQQGQLPVGYFTGTGMHGGKIFLRSDFEPEGLPPQVICREATEEDKQQILPYVQDFCGYFGGEAQQLLAPRFYLLLPNTQNPYKQLYVNN